MSRNISSKSRTGGASMDIPRGRRWIMHMDMDAFFASIEQLDDPSLRGKPVIVGGGHRGVVSTCSYEARKYGVHSAMPMFEAHRLCPGAVYVRPRMRRYAEMSALVRSVLDSFSPKVEMASVDEAYLDIAGLERLFGSVEDIGRSLKQTVREATGGLTCSVGIAPVKFLAKIASEQRKPDGIFVLYPEDVPQFLSGLPVTAVPGVGKRFAEELARMGIRTCGQAASFGRDFFSRRFGKAGEHLFDKARGIDPSVVEPQTPRKSESSEITLDRDTRDRDILGAWLLYHAERVGFELRRKKLAGRTVTLKVKYEDFRQITRQTSLDYRICSTDAIYRAAKGLLDVLELTGKVRLIGVGVSGFEEHGPAQATLLPGNTGEAAELRRSRLELAVDRLREKYGMDTVRRGMLPPEEERRRKDV